MKKIDKTEIEKKLDLLMKGMSDEKKDWIEQYANIHSLNESSLMEQPIGTDVPDVDPETDRLPSLLPMYTKVAAQTIGQNLVSVKPNGI